MSTDPQSRRTFAAAILVIVGLGIAHVDAASRPNVLLILSDDLRPQLGCYGDSVVRTPQLDRFAETALRFDRAYVQCAICSPSCCRPTVRWGSASC